MKFDDSIRFSKKNKIKNNPKSNFCQTTVETGKNFQ